MQFSKLKYLIFLMLLIPGTSQALEVYSYFGLATGYAVREQAAPANHHIDSGEKVYMGFRFLGPIGLEFAYYDLGKYVNETMGVSAVSVDAVFNLDIRGMTIFAKAGIVEWREKDLATGASDKGEDVTFGIGINLAVDRHVLFRTELERFRKVGRDTATGDPGIEMSLFSFGINFQF